MLYWYVIIFNYRIQWEVTSSLEREDACVGRKKFINPGTREDEKNLRRFTKRKGEYCNFHMSVVTARIVYFI